MTQSLKDALLMALYDLSDEVKAELSELNQLKDNVTKGPDHKLFERGIKLAMIQGKRQMIHALESAVQSAQSDAQIIEFITAQHQQINALITKYQAQILEQHTSPDNYYQEGFLLANVYETKGKAYIIQSIGAKINKIHPIDGY